MDSKLCGTKPTSPSLPKAHPDVSWPFEGLLVRQPYLLIVLAESGSSPSILVSRISVLGG